MGGGQWFNSHPTLHQTYFDFLKEAQTVPSYKAYETGPRLREKRGVAYAQ